MSGVKYKETPSRSETEESIYDEIDKPPHSHEVTCKDLGSLIYSLIFHFSDVAFDIYLAYAYYSTKKYSYFAWTVTFLVISSIILTLISIRMYVEDSKDKTDSRSIVLRIFLCIFGTLFQLALPIRYLDSLRYAIKSLMAGKQRKTKEQEKYFLKMLNEDSDVALLKVFECYLESAPQQVLQITLLVLDHIEGSKTHTNKQILFITLGFLSMGWCMANYHRCIRFDQLEKKNITVLGIVVQFFWHLNITVSRILAISALAVLYTTWTCIGIVIHWLATTVWVGLKRKSNFCGNQIFELFFYSSIGIVYIFNFLNLKEGSTRNSYILFYLLCFVENIVAVTIWGIKATHLVTNWIYYLFIILPILCFVLSICCLILYYQYLHPNKLKSNIISENNILSGDYDHVTSHNPKIDEDSK